MGVSRSPAELARKLAGAGAGVHQATVAGVRGGALLVTTAVRAELNAVAPSGRLRGVGKSGAKVSAAFDMLSRAEPVAAIVKMRGPAQLIERPTKPHDIPGDKKRRKPKRLRFADGNVRAIAHHPGTSGKQPFARGVERSAKQVPEVMKVEQLQSLRRFFT